MFQLFKLTSKLTKSFKRFKVIGRVKVNTKYVDWSPIVMSVKKGINIFNKSTVFWYLISQANKTKLTLKE